MPELRAGCVRVKVHCSLFSPGTEFRGWRTLSGSLRGNGNGDGDGAGEEPAPQPFGYSNAGVVVDCAPDVTRLKPGDRVACIGAGSARHAEEAVVPQNLCTLLPASVNFEQGSYAMLLATALHALRRGEVRLGEYVGVLGLGLVGQLTARLAQLAGARVAAWDLIARRCEMARALGIGMAEPFSAAAMAEGVRRLSGGQGLDAAIFAFDGHGQAAMEATVPCMQRSPDGHATGRIVIVGHTTFEYQTRPITNLDIRQAGRTGPGYHDPAWETGADYPPVFVRWNTQTNLELCLALVAEGRLAVECLTTHRIPLRQLEQQLPAVMEHPDDALGVVLTMR